MGRKYGKLAPRQTGELLRLFAAGSTARAAADRVGIHHNTAARFFAKVRAVIAAHQERAMTDAFDGPVEIDESYFGGRRKGSGVGERPARWPCSASSSGAGPCPPR